MSVPEIAASFNVSRSVIRAFFLRRKLWRRPYRLEVGTTHYLRADIAALYSEGRATRKPEGYVSVKRVLSDLPLRGREHLGRLEREGKVTVIRFRKNLYLSPDDARYVRQTLLDRLPLPGWVPLAETARNTGKTRQALAAWLKRRNSETRIYLDTESHQFVRHLTRKDADEYVRERCKEKKPTNPRPENA